MNWWQVLILIVIGVILEVAILSLAVAGDYGFGHHGGYQPKKEGKKIPPITPLRG